MRPNLEGLHAVAAVGVVYEIRCETCQTVKFAGANLHVAVGIVKLEIAAGEKGGFGTDLEIE